MLSLHQYFSVDLATWSLDAIHTANWYVSRQPISNDSDGQPVMRHLFGSVTNFVDDP
ncbi:MAG: hypothetical protein R3C05_16415 [Pirellulaceae bacterium]